jgi:hypothetical protein
MLAAALIAGPASAVVLDVDRDPVAALLPDSAAGPFAGVGTVSSAGFSCTGTAVGARLVLTAAHCLGDGDDSVRFRLPYGDAEPVEREGRATLHPDYAPGVAPFEQRRSPDVAVIEFDEPLPDTVPRASLPTGDASTLGTPFELVGYGESGTGETGSTPDTEPGKRFALNVVDQEPGHRGRFSADFDPPGAESLGHLEGTSGYGDSGGPAFAKADLVAAFADADGGPVEYMPVSGQRLLIGVVSYMSLPRDGQPFGTYGGSATWTALAAVAGWVAGFGADVALVPFADLVGCAFVDGTGSGTAVPAAAPVPLAPPAAFLVAGLGALIALGRRRRRTRDVR